jgi:hypothetical protein
MYLIRLYNVSIYLTLSVTLFYIIIKILNNLSSSYDIHLKFCFHHCVLRGEMNKTKSYLHIFFNKLTHCYFKSSISTYSSWIDCVNFFSFFDSVRFASAQLTSSPLFPLPGVVSPSIDVITQLCRVTIPSHRAKMSSLSLLHLVTTLRPVASPLKPKMKYWICTTTAGHPPRTVRLLPSTAIKMSSQSWPLSPPLNHIFILLSP